MSEKTVNVVGTSEKNMKDVTDKLKKMGAKKILALRSQFVNLDPERDILVFTMTVRELLAGMEGLMSHKNGGTCNDEMYDYIKDQFSRFIKDGDDKKINELVMSVAIMMAASSLATEIASVVKKAEEYIKEQNDETFESAEPINDLVV